MNEYIGRLMINISVKSVAGSPHVSDETREFFLKKGRKDRIARKEEDNGSVAWLGCRIKRD